MMKKEKYITPTANLTVFTPLEEINVTDEATLDDALDYGIMPYAVEGSINYPIEGI